MKQYVNIEDYQAFHKFSQAFESVLLDYINNGFSSIVFMCIGTDRSTGDSLGPLIGYKLSNLRYENIYTYGTLDNPVHAKNLKETIDMVYKKHSNPLIIAIDACLGTMEHVGYISVSKGPIKPGAGVNKELPLVGDISITGIVNFGGFMDFIILQNTRLNLVMKMADIISLGIKYTIHQLGSHEFSVLNKSPIQYALE